MRAQLFTPSDPASPLLPAEMVQLTQEQVKSALVGKRIVVVEDEGITQMQLRRVLTAFGLQVAATANNGERGVEAVLRERPDIVLMDIKMPGPFDGLEAARRILNTYRVCVVMLTAYSLDEFRQKARDAGTCGYVIKPVTASTLLPVLAQAYIAFNDRGPKNSPVQA